MDKLPNAIGSIQKENRIRDYYLVCEPKVASLDAMALPLKLQNGNSHHLRNKYRLLDCNPFNSHWLSDTAEKAITGEVDEEEDGYMLNALVEAVFRNAGIPMSEETE